MPTIPTPELDIDALMLSKYKRKLTPQQKWERRIVANLIGHLRLAGWHVSSVWDGEENAAANTCKDAMELIFNLDDAHVYFRNDVGSQQWVFLVLGNGVDIVSDWSIDEDELSFSEAMDAFDSEEFT